MKNVFDSPSEKNWRSAFWSQRVSLSQGKLAKGMAQSVTRRQALKKFGVGLAGMAFLNCNAIRLAAGLGLLLATSVPLVRAGTTPGSLTFSDTPLIRNQEGGSEPAIAIAANGTMAITSLPWVHTTQPAHTHLWIGPFGSTPAFQGLLGADLQLPGNLMVGSGADADVDFGATGTLHAGTLDGIFQVNPDGSLHLIQFGISAFTCPDATAPGFSLSGCTQTILDMTTADRPWISSEGQHVYLTYHDPATVNPSSSVVERKVWICWGF